MSDNNFNNEKLSKLVTNQEKDKVAPVKIDDKPSARPRRSGLEERDFQPVRQKRTGKTGFLGGFMYFVFVISVSIILACVGWMAASDVLALNKPELTVEVTFPEEIFTKATREVTKKDGTTSTKTYYISDIGKVSTILKDNGIIEYKSLFKLYSSMSNAKIKIDPGTYSLSTLYDYRAIIKKMQFGSDSQVKTKVTFPEGYTMMQIFALLEENKICRVEELTYAAANVDFSYTFLENIPLGDARRLEGFLFPDTYEFYQGMTASAAIDTFLLNLHNYKFTVDVLDTAAARGMSMRDIMNVASLIEREAANDEERSLIASVIYNRIKAGMPLQIDATSIYSHQDYEGDFRDMINTWVADTTDVYNTRHTTGLPPTPIANPGMPSINAALKPETTGNYYYALDTATKTHRFFANGNEFNAFVSTQNYNVKE